MHGLRRLIILHDAEYSNSWEIIELYGKKNSHRLVFPTQKKFNRKPAEMSSEEKQWHSSFRARQKPTETDAVRLETAAPTNNSISPARGICHHVDAPTQVKQLTWKIRLVNGRAVDEIDFSLTTFRNHFKFESTT